MRTVLVLFVYELVRPWLIRGRTRLLRAYWAHETRREMRHDARHRDQ